MSDNADAQTLIETADSLAEFIEKAETQGIPQDKQAAQLLTEVWDRELPQSRVSKILHRERERLNSYQRVSLSESARAPRYMDLTDLELVSGHEFEHLLAEILSRVEGDATVTEASGDQGVDVVWFRDNETVGIQAKAYATTNPVGNTAVQEIHTGAVVRQSEYEIDTPAVVTTSRYTNGAQKAADNSNVTLYDHTHLKQWLANAEIDAETVGNILNHL